MKAAVVIYPHQLFNNPPALAAAKAGGLPVYLVEESLLLTYNPIHRQKLIFHKLSLDAYEAELNAAGQKVFRLSIEDYPTTESVFERLRADRIETVHITDTTDAYLEGAIAASSLTRVWYESPLFLLEKADAVERYLESKRFMARFYKKLRVDKNILIAEDGSPIGGQWSFDAENRQKLPKNIELPEDITFINNDEVERAIEWAKTVSAEQYGEAGCWVPYTRAAAQKFLEEFLRCRFHHFGAYEDAINTTHTRLFHSTLSPLLNVGLLSPKEVLTAALTFADTQNIPLNSLEGFVRQILGWREFIRASYECDGSNMRTQNFWQHTRPLPASMWQATTGLPPLDTTNTHALKFGYTHHIERLMVLGNFMLLTRTDPDQIYRWFMGMYVDAYDWVMVPNVYGMSQFADGGSFATKPYISGSNYLKKMSNYPAGEWEEVWTALYWQFIDDHQKIFLKNHRLAMMPRLLAKMDEAKRKNYRKIAQDFMSGKNKLR